MRQPGSGDAAVCGALGGEEHFSFYLRTVHFSHRGRKFCNALVNAGSKKLEVVFLDSNHNAYFYKTGRQEKLLLSLCPSGET